MPSALVLALMTLARDLIACLALQPLEARP